MTAAEPVIATRPTQYLDAVDQLHRVIAMLDYMVEVRGNARQSHPGENWILDEIADSVRETVALLTAGGAT